MSAACAGGASADAAPGDGADGRLPEDEPAGGAEDDPEAASDDDDGPVIASGRSRGVVRFNAATMSLLKERVKENVGVLSKPPSDTLCGQWAAELLALAPQGAAGAALRDACTAKRVLAAVNRERKG